MASTRAASRPDVHTFAGDVGVVVWPTQRDVWVELVAAGTPRLLLVEEASTPPVGADCCQDWMWRSGSESELRFRVRQLSLRALVHGRAMPQLDSLGMLHVGLRSVSLPPKEQALVVALLDRFGDIVSREELVAAAWPAGIRMPNVLSSRISSLRARLACVGLEIVGSKRAGYALRAMQSVAAVDAPGGFDAELKGPGRLLADDKGATEA